LKACTPKVAVLFGLLIPGLLLSPAISTVFASPTVQTGLMWRASNPAGASYNWAGYAVTGSANSISVATASWVVPPVVCPSTGSTYASFWVGIDGFSSTTVEQTGTDSDCLAGTPTYSAWYEFYPATSVPITTLSISPSDVMVAVVYFSGGEFTAAIKDVTTGKSFSTSSSVSGAQRNSAEFIVEAPLVCSLVGGCSLAKLSDFGLVAFGQGNTGQPLTCGLVMNGVPGSITTFASQANYIAMVRQSNSQQFKALPGLPTSGGSSFRVQFLNAGP
jgi:hypothetical protein